MATVEGLDESYTVGGQPIYGWCDSTSQWLRIRCDSDGRLLVSDAETDSSVLVPTTAGDTVRTGAALGNKVSLIWRAL